MEGFYHRVPCGIWMGFCTPTLCSPVDHLVHDTTPVVHLVLHDDEVYLAMLGRSACSRTHCRCRVGYVESDADLHEEAKPWPGAVEFATGLAAFATAAIYGKVMESFVGVLCMFVLFYALRCRRRVVVVHQVMLQHKTLDGLRATLHHLEAMASGGCGVVLLCSSEYIPPLLPHAILVRLPAREDADFQRDLFRILRATQPSPRYPKIGTIRAIEGVLGRRALAVWLRASPELLDELLAGGALSMRQLLPLARLLIALEFGARVGAPPEAMEATPGCLVYNFVAYCVALKKTHDSLRAGGEKRQDATQSTEQTKTEWSRFPQLPSAVPPDDEQRVCNLCIDALHEAFPNIVKAMLETSRY